MPGIFSPDLFRHGSVLHPAVAHLISVLSAGKGMGGKGMKTSEIPLPPIPLQVSAAALPHVHHAWHLFSPGSEGGGMGAFWPLPWVKGLQGAFLTRFYFPMS